ncbi:MAG: N-acetylglutaminylglutamine synthetase [Inquilinaceae bacterium]
MGERTLAEKHSRNDDGTAVANIALDCGWGRLLFGQTFDGPEALAAELRREQRGERDVAFYVEDPHVVLALAPQELFLDPSHTYRLDLSAYEPLRETPDGVLLTPVTTTEEADEANRIYSCHGMMPVDSEFMASQRRSRAVGYLIAKERVSGSVLGVVMGADHDAAFGDPEGGSSLWSLAIDPQCPYAGVGVALVRRLAEHFRQRGRRFMDLSVLHDNHGALALYEKLGFRRVPVFTVKRRNPINERLYAGPSIAGDYNPYAQIIIDEARRRGIQLDPVDPAAGYYRLSFGGRTVLCRESLSELTSAVAMSQCDDKQVTRRVLERAGLAVPAQIDAVDDNAIADFLDRHGEVVVKPARGEQGAGVAVGLHTMDDVMTAIAIARKICDRVLIEQCVGGDDLRIIVIDYRVVAAAIRRPAEIAGDGQRTVMDLIERQSRRRASATGGESKIPLDEETARCVAEAGYAMDEVLPAGQSLRVRKAANLHTGGTIHDVTAKLHPTLVEAAATAAGALDIPVVGMDFLVPAVDGPDYVIIEANERPGLANHEPQPTAQRFIDLLFPQTIVREV